MNNKSLLYMLHVSWFWIKQRPHFLAEELSKFYQINVACLEDYDKQAELSALSSKTLMLYSFKLLSLKIPIAFLQGRVSFFYKQMQLARLIKQNKFLWFSSPQQFLLSKKYITDQHIVIYDCMDDHSNFYKDEIVKNRIMELERYLCKRANYIIVSANVLKYRLENKYSPDCPIKVVNNALAKKSVVQKTAVDLIHSFPIFEDRSKIKITYIGTISSWFNFESIIEMLNKYQNCQLVVVGPNECVLPKHHQIVYLGKVNHDLVSDLMRLSDVLIMPFIINDLVKAVNPVKAYEYIASGKPVILTKYEETTVFEDFAYLYEDLNELDILFRQVSNKSLAPKKALHDCIVFANSNTWDIRARDIVEFISTK